MLSGWRGFITSCALDDAASREGRRSAESGMLRVHRLLSDAVPPDVPPPAGLRGRVLHAVYESAPERAGLAASWRWGAALAAGLAVAIGAAVYLAAAMSAPDHAGQRGPELGGILPLAIDPGPMIRRVADSVDQPLLDQAEKVVADTKRATRAVMRCIPFAAGG